MIVYGISELVAGGLGRSRKLSCRVHIHVVMWAASFPTLHFAYSQAPPYSSPLGVSARYGHAKIVQLLLNGGANINYQNKVKSTHCTTEPYHAISMHNTAGRVILDTRLFSS